MKIVEMESNLKMRNLYFSRCSIERHERVESGEFNADLQRKIRQIGEHEFNVELTLKVEKEDLSLEIVARAGFSLEADDYSMEEDFIKTNTVAIMFPFIRSQVTLLTTQPGMTPIVLPTINTMKFFD